jgi:hypothetical protein
MKLRRRETEVFSLSFLDCICCGFGAIILLLVLTQYGEPQQFEQSRKDLNGRLLKLQQELFELRGETDELDRRLHGRLEDLSRERLRLAQLEASLTNVRGQYRASHTEAQVSNIVEGELVAAYQTLTAEMQRLLKERAKRPPSEAIGGIPIDSEYIVFVIDTSGSMLMYHWDTATEVMKEILDIYPRVKGLQVMSDQGGYMFEGTKGQWLTDSAQQRERIVKRMDTWRTYSKSSPVAGIEEAIRRYAAPDKRVSVYVLGDEFTDDSIQEALDEVRRLNKPDAQGRKPVRIHGIGFPNAPDYPPFTSIRLTALMRAICEENNGTFVGITTEKPCRATINLFGVNQCIR